MLRAVVAVFGVVLFAFLGVWMFQGALAVAGDTTTNVNESFNPTVGSFTTLEDSNIDGAYYRNETTVYNSSDFELEENDDYFWSEKNGSVKALSSPHWDGSNATITYSYDLATEEMQTVAGVLALIPQNIGLVLFAFMALFVVMFFRL